MNHEKSVELKRFPVLHKLSAGKDGHVVRREHSRSRCESREGSRTWYKDECVGRMSHDSGKKLVEVRPQLHNEGSVQRRKANGGWIFEGHDSGSQRCSGPEVACWLRSIFEEKGSMSGCRCWKK